MKKLILILTATLMATAIYAVPAKRGQWRTIKLADGTEVKAEFRGDEFGSFYRTEDGRLFIRDAGSGLYKQTNAEALDAEQSAKRASARAARAKRAAKMKVIPGEEHAPYIGAKRGLIILVNFADVKFNEEHNVELYKRIANEEGFTNEMRFRGSVRDYFKAQSLGQFDLTFDVLGPVTMPEGYAYYGTPTSGSDDNDVAVANMVVDACKAVDDEVDFNTYDWDGDGEADQVFILYAGYGEASHEIDPNTIWPHEWELASVLGYGGCPTLDGVRINTYACGSELGEDGKIDGIGTICHEFSHCLGLPDMYDTSYSGYYGMDLWSIMDYGSYNDDGFCPPNYTSYERMYAGWQQPIELNDNIEVTGMESLTKGGNTYIIYNDGHRDEYFLLENRQLDGWDAALPNSGLLILHVDFDATVWYNNKVNATATQRCTIFHADNQDLKSYEYYSQYIADRANDIYPYGDNNSLTNTSTPKAILNNWNTSGTFYMNKPVTEITKHDDGTISFNFQNNNRPSGINDISAGEKQKDNRVFTIDGRYVGNDLDALNKGVYIINGKKIIK